MRTARACHSERHIALNASEGASQREASTVSRHVTRAAQTHRGAALGQGTAATK